MKTVKTIHWVWGGLTLLSAGLSVYLLANQSDTESINLSQVTPRAKPQRKIQMTTAP